MQLCSGHHRGTWWLPHASDVSVEGENGTRPVAAVASHPETNALLQLASKQRMNTDRRRAIFCVLMSADDYVCPSTQLRPTDSLIKLLVL